MLKPIVLLLGDVFLRFQPPAPFAYGPRLYLRPPWRGDQNAWLKIRAKSRKFLKPWEPSWHSDALTPTGYKRWLSFAQHGLKTMSDVPLLIFSHNDHLLGGLTLKDIRFGAAQTIGLGYWMGVEHAGNEHIVEAIAAIGLYCFEHIGINRIEAACLPRNTRSRRVLEKLHFQKEGYLHQLYRINGVWEDHNFYALLARDRHHLDDTLTRIHNTYTTS